MGVRRLDPVQPEDFAFSGENLAWAREQIGKYPRDRHWSAVIPLLWRAQEQSGGWLPEPAIRYVAEMLEMPYIRALEVATFYTMFNLSPVGEYHVQLCGTTPCWLRGADDLKAVCRDVIGEPETVTEDGKFSWIEVECLGACVNAPMVQINKDYYEDLTAESFKRILEDLRNGKTVKPGPQVDRQTSAPVGDPKSLTSEDLFNGNYRRLWSGGAGTASADAEAKPGRKPAGKAKASPPGGKSPATKSSATTKKKATTRKTTKAAASESGKDGKE